MPRALLSVYDKNGISEFAKELVELGWEVISSGGTAAHLRESGITVIEVAEITNTPEMLNGRVKTLHPNIHGAILADRSNPEHLADLKNRNIKLIDLVVVNLYPFSEEPGIELIDIGGPTMVRAAAKNHSSLGVVIDPLKYSTIIEEIKLNGLLSNETKRNLARDAFAHTAAYDAAIVTWFDKDILELPKSLHFSLEKTTDLRYGENPHQSGARYRFFKEKGWWDDSLIHGGKQMSYLNLFDAEAAWKLVNELGDNPSAVVIKHANPCGAASANSIEEAYLAAHACDSVSAFGGVVGLNRSVTKDVAEELAGIFTEVIIAPSYEQEALKILQERQNLRIIEAPIPSHSKFDLKSLDGGLLIQTSDSLIDGRSQWNVVTEREPTENEWIDLEFAWKVAARVSSNAIVLVKNSQAVGIGAGQQNRRDAARIAAQKAEKRALGGACASDAFFPFRDGLDAAIDSFATSVIQPGGSVRDQEVIDAANEAGLAMVFTGYRHFRH